MATPDATPTVEPGKRNTEPVLTYGVIAGAIVALLAIFHVIIDVNTITAILVIAIPLLSDLLKRAAVVPVAKLRRRDTLT